MRICTGEPITAATVSRWALHCWNTSAFNHWFIHRRPKRFSSWTDTVPIIPPPLNITSYCWVHVSRLSHIFVESLCDCFLLLLVLHVKSGQLFHFLFDEDKCTNQGESLLIILHSHFCQERTCPIIQQCHWWFIQRVLFYSPLSVYCRLSPLTGRRSEDINFKVIISIVSCSTVGRDDYRFIMMTEACLWTTYFPPQGEYCGLSGISLDHSLVFHHCDIVKSRLYWSTEWYKWWLKSPCCTLFAPTVTTVASCPWPNTHGGACCREGDDPAGCLVTLIVLSLD